MIQLAAAKELLWFDHPAIKNLLVDSINETLLMVGWATVASVLVGLPVGIAVVATRKDGVRPAPIVNAILGFIVNLGRAIPFIILLILIYPITQAVMGTGMGWRAVFFPLAVASFPFFARLVETNLLAVDSGKVEAAQMMGASRTRIMFDVLVREALPGIIQSITVLVITLIGYSAMGGAVGGGGLGALAYNYGYARYNIDVLIITVAIILIIVQVVQWLGDMISRYVDHR